MGLDACRLCDISRDTVFAGVKDNCGMYWHLARKMKYVKLVVWLPTSVLCVRARVLPDAVVAYCACGCSGVGVSNIRRCVGLLRAELSAGAAVDDVRPSERSRQLVAARRKLRGSKARDLLSLLAGLAGRRCSRCDVRSMSVLRWPSSPSRGRPGFQRRTTHGHDFNPCCRSGVRWMYCDRWGMHAASQQRSATRGSTCSERRTRCSSEACSSKACSRGTSDIPYRFESLVLRHVTQSLYCRQLKSNPQSSAAPLACLGRLGRTDLLGGTEEASRACDQHCNPPWPTSG